MKTPDQQVPSHNMETRDEEDPSRNESKDETCLAVEEEMLMAEVLPCHENSTSDTTKSNLGEDSIFEQVGISHDTAQAMAECSLPRIKIVDKKIGGTKHKVKVTAAWKALPILQRNRYRAYGGDYQNVCLSSVKECNPYCSFTVFRSYIKKIDSRKSTTPFFTGKGRCQTPCQCVFTITLNCQNDTHLLISFEGDIKHDITKPMSRQIRGSDRQKEKEKYLQNTQLNLSDVYRQKLFAVPPVSFACGNRDGAGISKKTHQNIKAETIRDINSSEVLHKELLKLQKKFMDIDNKNCLKSNAKIARYLDFYRHFLSHKIS